jgi:predicted metal-binding protein
VTRPALSICTRCEGGERLHAEVEALRCARGLESHFTLNDVGCLNCCDDPIAIELYAAGRATHTRIRVAPNLAASIVAAAVACEGLAPGEALPAGLLPGEDR